MRLMLAVLTALLVVVNGQYPKFKVIREWKNVNFTWPNSASYQTAFDNGQYIPKNVVISGVKYHDGFYYITLPRMKDGVPATLTRIPAGPTKETAPLLEPYPSWQMNIQGDCNSLQNVQNIEIDPRGHIWIIDGGRTETLNRSPIVKCPPKLVIFDIKMNMTTTNYVFPEEVASYNGSFLYDIVLDLSDGGYAYITDNSGRDPGLIVYSVKENKSWKIRHSPSMRADPAASEFKVNEVTVSAPINIAGIALSPKVQTNDDRVTINSDREVYYSPLSSLHLYSINTAVLKDPKNANNGNEYQGAVIDYGLKASQSVGMIMDNSGNLYYGLLASNAITRWDTKAPFSSNQKPIARDAEYLQWVNSFTIEDSGNMTVLVNKLSKFIYGGFDNIESKYRLITAFIGTKNYLNDESFAYKEPETTSTEQPSSSTNHMNSQDKMPMETTQPPSSGASSIILSSVLFLSSLFLYFY